MTIVIYSNGVEHFKALFEWKTKFFDMKNTSRNLSLSSKSSHGNQCESTQKSCVTHAQNDDSMLYWKMCVRMRDTLVTLAAFVPPIAGNHLLLVPSNDKKVRIE